MSRTEQFLEKYRELEDLIRIEFSLKEGNNDSPIGFLLRQEAFRNIKSDLNLCKDVRNLLAHNRKIQNVYVVEPSEEMISLLDTTILKIRRIPHAMDIAVKIEQILWRSIDDAVLPVMKLMNERSISHIPILENGVVTGVFSDNTIMSYLMDETIIEAADNIQFSDLKKYLPLEAHRADSFRFIARNTQVTKITEIFSDSMTKSERIGLVFVTASGKKTEKLLGIITAWDLAASSSI